MQSNSDITPLIIDAISDKKGKKTVVVDLSSLDSASASKLIICQGNSTSQVAAIADSVRKSLILNVESSLLITKDIRIANG